MQTVAPVFIKFVQCNKNKTFNKTYVSGFLGYWRRVCFLINHKIQDFNQAFWHKLQLLCIAKFKLTDDKCNDDDEDEISAFALGLDLDVFFASLLITKQAIALKCHRRI